ncbi:hypothetical protein IE81DRAFT_184650 [Ceraceosorus guamensis]|uniref:Uncharacterized protein n=1 Tax=Ceraceosorus guamensis TaxID=1522189 RepID=A0A316VUD3_9BASI|nr:hypothetical protein IE81DRAFT_184650 [Ceraceosorus guamensis]PWN41209.1 hypothetical protein IE81DRAFT_184650 [Ceraceosorus guamensis]
MRFLGRSQAFKATNHAIHINSGTVATCETTRSCPRLGFWSNQRSLEAQAQSYMAINRVPLRLQHLCKPVSAMPRSSFWLSRCRISQLAACCITLRAIKPRRHSKTACDLGPRAEVWPRSAAAQGAHRWRALPAPREREARSRFVSVSAAEGNLLVQGSQRQVPPVTSKD